jgi:CheY-like chemotaxis protein
VILLDVVMPGRHGVEILQDIRSDPSLRDIPVAVVTSHTLAASDRDTVLRSADALLSKAELSRPALSELVRGAAARRAEPRPGTP